MATEISVSTRKGDTVPLRDGLFASLGNADLRRFRFTGRPKPNQVFSGNFVECLFEDVELEGIDFTRCDWKDCRLNNTIFVDCDLTSASVITNSFDACRFVRCRFSDTSISNCNFRSCIFENSDLSNVIMKSNRVELSEFHKCKTSNRIIESSLLLDTRWLDMNLEIDLLLGNFGLRCSDVVNCQLYKKTASGEFRTLEWDALDNQEITSNLSLIEQFRLAFFKTGTADGDPQIFEDVLNPKNWSGDAIIQSSFGDLLSNFSQFVLALYDDNRLPAYAILHFHTHNFRLLEWLSDKRELSSLYQVAAGVHLTLTREVDAFGALLTSITNWFGKDSQIPIEADGPLEKQFFISLFNDLGLSNVTIDSLRPRNSPLELLVSAIDSVTCISLIAIVLASRTKFELIKLRQTKNPEQQTGTSDQTSAQTGQALIRFNSGFSELKPSEFQINVQTLLPRSLLLDLHLNISVALFKKVRSVLLTLLLEKSRSHS